MFSPIGDPVARNVYVRLASSEGLTKSTPTQMNVVL